MIKQAGGSKNTQQTVGFIQTKNTNTCQTLFVLNNLESDNELFSNLESLFISRSSGTHLIAHCHHKMKVQLVLFGTLAVLCGTALGAYKTYEG